MTIHLPKDVESSIEAAVHSGHFASADDALATAWRAFQQHSGNYRSRICRPGIDRALRDDAELLDQAVEHAMKVREERPWRMSPGE